MFKRWFGGRDDKSQNERPVIEETTHPLAKKAEPEDIAAKLKRLVGEGRKIEAIRVYRDASGVDLQTAKKDIEALIAEVEQAEKAASSSPSLQESEAGLQTQMERAMRQGKKIEAIKLYRQATGLGLKESKDVIDAAIAGGYVPQLSGGVAMMSKRPSPEVQEGDILAMLRAGKKIDAVKLYRQMTGEGLKESKEAVEEIGRRHGL